MADYNLGTARGQVTIDYDSTGEAAANRGMENLQKNSRGVNESFNTMARGMAIAGAAIAAGIGLAVKSAITFEQRLSGIKAVSGATADDMEKVRQKALQLGKDTKFSASEAAQAMEELAKAGLTIPEIMNGAADATVALAAAGEVALPRAAEIAANAMNVFSLSAADLPKVADLIAGAANASAISVEEFAQSLQQSGAAAALVGVDFDDLATAIALMGNAGIKGSDAGTSLKTFLQNLQPDTVKQTALFKELGLVTEQGGNAFFDAAGKIKPLSEVAQVLQDSLKGMTDQQKQATLNTLFGSDAIRAAAIIAKGGSAGFNELAASMGKVTAEGVAAERMNNLAGDLEELKGSLETAAISIGTLLIPALRSLVDNITGVVNGFMALDPSTQSLILKIAGISAALLLFGAATIKTVQFIMQLVTAFRAISAAMIAFSRLAMIAPIMHAIAVAARVMWAALLGPVGLIIAAVALIAAGLVLLYQKNETFRNIVQAVWGWLRDNVPPIVQAIWSAIVTAWNAIVSATQATMSAIRTAWTAVWGTIGPIVTTAFSVIVKVIQTGIAIISAVISAGMVVVRVAFSIFQTVAPIVIGVLNIIRLAFELVFNVIKLIVLAVFVAIYYIVSTYINMWRAVIGAGLNAIQAVFSTVMAGVRAVVSVGMNAVQAVFSSVMNAIRAIANSVLGQAIGAAARQGASAVMAAINAIRAVIGIIAGIFNSVVSTISGAMSRAAGAVQGGLSGIVGAVASVGGRMYSAGAQIIQMLINGITSRIQGAINAVKSAIARLTNLLPGSPVKEGPLKVLNRGYAGGQIVKMLADGITAQRGMLRARAAAAVAGAREELDALARTQEIGLNASVGVSGVMTTPTARSGGANASAVSSGGSAGGGRTVVYDVDVHNPPPVSGERQVTDALRRVETLYSPFQGVNSG